MPTRYFYQNVTQVCRRCRQPGHFEKWCTEEKPTGLRCVLCCGDHLVEDCNSIVCFRCNGVGHMAKDCKRHDSTVCFRCNKRGHKVGSCGILVFGNNLEKEKDETVRDIKCIQCGKYGHINCEKLVNRGDISYSDDLYWDMDRPLDGIATWMDAVKREQDLEQKYYRERQSGVFSNDSSWGLDTLEKQKQSRKKDKRSPKKSRGKSVTMEIEDDSPTKNKKRKNKESSRYDEEDNNYQNRNYKSNKRNNEHDESIYSNRRYLENKRKYDDNDDDDYNFNNTNRRNEKNYNNREYNFSKDHQNTYKFNGDGQKYKYKPKARR